MDIKTKLKIQQEIFGDDLFESVNFTSLRKDGVNSENSIKLNSVIKSVNYTLDDSNELFEEDFQKSDSLDELYDKIHECQKCPLGSTRTNFVFGSGNPNADLMLIGEAPGAEEDKQGVPFVGRAGKLLTDILKSINFEREDVYIANILKCRPPNNRDPLPSERETCFPYLIKQIELIKPKIILCLGRISANALLGKNESLTRLRENIYEFHGVKVMATYHPAALLRNPHWKRGCWEDIKKVRRLFDELTK
ncbi:MAG: uracil-DNA glycosylase [Melioribacteraceae bacterium]|nr:uracil-DNA glycosylase [Melioribacteraceae bacterium]